MKRSTMIFLAGGAVLLVLAGIALTAELWTERPADERCATAAATPRMRPDYVGVVIPPNIAPLNFVVEEPGERYCVRISATNGQMIEVVSDGPGIQIPPNKWRDLLQKNRGGAISVDVYVKSQGTWTRFKTIQNPVAREDIDGYLVYRFMPISLTYAGKTSIRQRDLSSFDERIVLASSDIGENCLNCHTFNNHSTDAMLLHVRTPQYGSGPAVYRDGKLVRMILSPDLKGAPGYTTWHPSGKAFAGAVYKVKQFFHTVGENRDTVDLASRLVIYRFDTNEFSSCPALSNPNEQTTYPVWSPDGRYLYYCVRPQGPLEEYRNVRYDLMRIPYDIDTDTWGKSEVILTGTELGRSLSHPRVSPDGRYLVFPIMDYGNFPISQPSADLCLLDLQTHKWRKLDISSPECDSYPSFSSNGRWIAFSSKRRDGLFSRPYFSYFDAEGQAHKPFLLPQESPTFYDGLIRTCSLPELTSQPIPVTRSELTNIITTSQPALVTEADPSAKP